jgi:hypothetical protein
VGLSGLRIFLRVVSGLEARKWRGPSGHCKIAVSKQLDGMAELLEWVQAGLFLFELAWLIPTRWVISTQVAGLGPKTLPVS